MSRKKKRETREEMRRVLESLDPRWVRAAERELCDRLSGWFDREGSVSEHVLAYASFFPGEADLSRFIAGQLGRRRIYLPRSRSDGSMSFYSIEDDWQRALSAGGYGIPEPGAGEPYDIAHAERTVVLVPGLAFDRSGNRVGRGRGHYDRFFGRPATIPSVKIGICWSLQLTPPLSSDSHDVVMDWICSEEDCLRVQEER